MEPTNPNVVEWIQRLKKDMESWNGVRTSFATTLQEWDSTTEEDMTLLFQNDKSVFPIKNNDYASTAYDIRESIMSKGIKVIKTLNIIRENTEEIISSLHCYFGMWFGQTFYFHCKFMEEQFNFQFETNLCR